MDGGSKGEVASTDPAAGTQLAAGGTVTLRVSTGEDGDLKVPDVTGDDLADAQRKLQQQGFVNVAIQVRATNDESDNGKVLDQSPSSGSRAAADERVVLLVGQFSGSQDNSGGGN